ncbi:MAG: hypothetical protein AABX38_06745 [Candidatus Micrarchaeota archaeon]
MGLTGKDSFVKQIVLYLKSENYPEAHKLAEDFVKLLPDELISHFLLAKSSFWVHEYEECVSEGKKAFNLANSKDLTDCAILVASAYYQLKKYSDAYVLLSKTNIKDNVEAQKLLFILSVTLNDEKAAVKHIDELFKINKKVAEELLTRYLV